MRLTPFPRVTAVLMLLSVSTIVTACTTDAKGSSPKTADGKESGAPGGAQQNGAQQNGARGGAAGRPNPTMTLAASDIATIAPTTIEAGTALTGDLRPIETIDVRSRI